jgi:hypothetical protein
MPKPIPDFLEILKILVSNEVDFIVIGGVCAVLHGAPVTTFDLDLVHSRVPVLTISTVLYCPFMRWTLIIENGKIYV